MLSLDFGLRSLGPGVLSSLHSVLGRKQNTSLAEAQFLSHQIGRTAHWDHNTTVDLENYNFMGMPLLEVNENISNKMAARDLFFNFLLGDWYPWWTDPGSCVPWAAYFCWTLHTAPQKLNREEEKQWGWSGASKERRIHGTFIPVILFADGPLKL